MVRHGNQAVPTAQRDSHTAGRRLGIEAVGVPCEGCRRLLSSSQHHDVIVSLQTRARAHDQCTQDSTSAADAELTPADRRQEAARHSLVPYACCLRNRTVSVQHGRTTLIGARMVYRAEPPEPHHVVWNSSDQPCTGPEEHSVPRTQRRPQSGFRLRRRGTDIAALRVIMMQCVLQLRRAPAGCPGCR